MKESVLIFGGNSFLGKAFNRSQKDNFDLFNVYRNDPEQELNFDFEDTNVVPITSKLTGSYKAILFFQGINPSVSASEMTNDHFKRMLTVNLITPALLVKNLVGQLSSNSLVLFISSVAKKKGSYDPAYAAAKAGLAGLMHSLAGAYPQIRFNMVSPGLIENSPVFLGMTPDYRQKHYERMNNSFVQAGDIVDIIVDLINNSTINRTDIELDG